MILDYLENNVEFTPSELEIRNVIIRHIDYVTSMSISELANACSVSVASINRFCQKIGFKGYTDFKITYIKEYKDIERNRAYDKVTPFTKTSSFEDVLVHVPYIYEKTVNYMKMALDKETIVRCVNLMNKATIWIFGTGLNKSLSDVFAYKVEELGLVCKSYDSMHYQSLEAMMYRKEPLFAILISHTGANHSILKAAKKLHKYRIPMLLIKSNDNNEMEKYCSNLVTILPTKTTMELSNTHYMIANQFVLDVIVSLLLVRNMDTAEYVRSKTEGSRLGD